MAAPLFYRHARAELPYVALMEPVQPGKRLQGRLEKLGFTLDESCGLWWCPLVRLGRANMSLKAIAAQLRSCGIEANVHDAPEYGVEEEAEVKDEESDEEHEDDDEEGDSQEDGQGEGGEEIEDEAALHPVFRASFFERVYEMYRKQESLEAQVATLHGMVARLAGHSSGEAGRSILVKEPGPVHLMDGRRAFIDLVRGCPVLDLPEERVRQRVLQHLVDHLGFPVHLLDSEHRIAHVADRADIVVRLLDAERGVERCLAVIECKEPGVPLNDDVRDQAKRYATKLKAPYLAITDGRSLLTWHSADGGANWRAVDGFPNLRMLLDEIPPAHLVSPTRCIPRPDFEDLLDPLYVTRLLRMAAIDEEDRFLINLASLFFDDRVGPKGQEFDGWRCVEDRQLVATSFGNAGYKSHAYPGPYRSLLLEHPQHGKVLTFYRTWNAGPNTMLALGIHHIEDGRRHHATQLNLRRAVEFGDEGFAEVRHTAKVSMGTGGSFKQADVVARVAAQAPDMVIDGRIYLGRLPTNRLITWEDAFPVLVRLLRFALAVDGLRTGTD